MTPKVEMITTVSMVKIVVALNVMVTAIRSGRLFFAAGYIKMGIRGSHGPNTKIVNKIQGVIFEVLFSSCLWL